MNSSAISVHLELPGYLLYLNKTNTFLIQLATSLPRVSKDSL